jgi:sec-independent protein translocase protein TatC
MLILFEGGLIAARFYSKDESEDDEDEDTSEESEQK